MRKLNRKKFIVLCLLLAGAAVFIWPGLATAEEDPNLVESIGEWIDAGMLNEARSGHTVTLLPDGRVLVAGGHNESGILASAEIYDPTSKMATVVASSLVTPRTGHRDILLEDGRVLLVGGKGADGALDSAEIFDPSTEAFVSVGPLNAPRLNHTATLLPDGQVLIVGGHDGIGLLPLIEIFDPNSNSFTLLGVALLEARGSHTATLLEDGRVLVAGGRDGTGPLATTEYIDPNALSVELGPTLTEARYGHTATRLMSGSVALVYGTDGTMALDTAEILAPDFNDVFMIVNDPNDPNLGRYNHAAVLLPQNGNLLLLGGYSAGGVADASAELLNPRTYEFSPVGSLQNARAECGVVADAGFVWAIGGTGLNETPLADIETLQYATLITSQIDYPENSDVIFMGSGWLPGETVEILIEESHDVNSVTTLAAVADANGNILNQEFNVGPDNAGVSFLATATGMSSGRAAMATFYDSPYISYLDPSSFKATRSNVYVTIHGYDFRPYNLYYNTVYISGPGVSTTLTIVSQTDSTIHVTIPSWIASRPGDYSIWVKQVTKTCGYSSYHCGEYCCRECCFWFYCWCCDYCPRYCCWYTDHYSNSETLRITNQRPVADAGPDQTVEQTSYEGARVTLNGYGSTDDGAIQPLEYDWSWTGGSARGGYTTATFPLGTTIVTLWVNDGQLADMDTVTITVEDTTPPVITLNGDAPMTLECGIDSYTEPGATATDICDPDVPVIIGGDTIDTSICGTYIVTYDATDNSGNAATQVTRTVTVQDSTPPVITLNGDTTMTLECGIDSYTEPGATATDICDPDVPVIIGGDTVDTSTCGTYVVTYDATDDSGNQAEQVARAVTVQDTTPPEFTFSVSPTILWPPNHKMVEITPSWTVSDICDPTPEVSLELITMNEGDETNTYDPMYDDNVGDGHTIDDIQVIDGRIYLRAERSGTGSGRVYTITYQAVDASGNTTVKSATVTVPHDQS